MATLVHSCEKVREATKLPFGVVIWVGPVIGVLDRVHNPKGEGEVWGLFLSIGLNGLS